MRTKFNVILTLLLALVVQLSFAQEKVITGVVTEDGSGEPIPGVNVIVEGTDMGTTTDFDGKYTIKAKVGDVLLFSYVGYADISRKVGGSNSINVVMKAGESLGPVTIKTVFGIKEKPKEVSYAQQVVKAKELNMAKDNNIKTALNGKIAGVQVAAQAGSKLGQAGKVYLRGGALSITGRSEALYIVDGVETNPENVDMENIASINVLKGSTAVALYGMRGANGVVLIQTKGGRKGKLSVEIFNNTTYDKVAYLPNYQNEYGQGYQQNNFSTFNFASFPAAPAEWAALDGARYNKKPYADESWGPKFDGEDFYPWYTWWPGENNSNPYFAKAQKYSAQPNNIKDFYNTGVQTKSGFAISGGTDKAVGRISFSRLNQNGIIPYTDLKNDNAAGKFSIKILDNLKVGITASLNKRHILGRFDDSYGNPVSGSFTQWFGRGLQMDRMRELKDLKTTKGYHASWNWWGPLLVGLDYFGEDTQKPVFWYNPYWQMEQDKETRNTDRYVGKIDIKFDVNDAFSLYASASKTGNSFEYNRKTPYAMQFSSNTPGIGFTDYLNAMSDYQSRYSLSELMARGNYDWKINDKHDLKIILGVNTRGSETSSLYSAMHHNGDPTDSGFVIPDLYDFSNSKQKIVPQPGYYSYKQVNVFNRLKYSFNNYLFLTGDISNSWDSRFDIKDKKNSNSFMFGSAGLSFVYSEVLKMPKFIDFGKLRLSYAKTGSVPGVYALNPSFGISGSSYNSNPLMFTPSTISNPNVKPALSTSIEAGTDIRMFNNRMLFSITYFDEHKTGEIVPVDVAQSSGVARMLLNAGDVQRTGIDLEISGTPINTKNFTWKSSFNFSNPYVKVLKLAEGQDSYLMGYSSFGVISVNNYAGEEFGQLVGNKIKRKDGQPVIDPSTGFYEFDDKLENDKFGSILPDFNGGFINSFTYKKALTLSANITYQKGGKFFSLTEWWGTYTGLLKETAGNNDKGNPQRDPVANGGGVHVTGVDSSGNPVDMYVEAHDYYDQQYSSTLAEGFVHDASFIKLAEVSLSYNFPKSILGKFIKGASIGVVARNLGMLYVDSSNKHNWDPSEFGYLFGDDAQLPGTKSYGFNVRIKL